VGVHVRRDAHAWCVLVDGQLVELRHVGQRLLMLLRGSARA
jgi:hypothetical protein